MKILVDTNILLDIVLEREPFYSASSVLFKYPDSALSIYITPSICTDIFYIVRKEKGREIALDFIADLLKAVELCLLEKSVFLTALASDFKDFEDAVQNFSAVENGLDAIVSRNKKDYVSSSLAIWTPTEFLDSYPLPQ